MLSKKFLIIAVVGFFIMIGLGIFPGFHQFFNGINTTGLDTEFLGFAKMMPYLFFGVIFYAAYIIWKKGK